jgi:hypothetical protein
VSNATLSCDKRQVAHKTSHLGLDFGRELEHVYRSSAVGTRDTPSRAGRIYKICSALGRDCWNKYRKNELFVLLNITVTLGKSHRDQFSILV